jgi:hypothetical protein
LIPKKLRHLSSLETVPLNTPYSPLLKSLNQGKETKGFLFSRISYGAQELAVFLLENSPSPF